MANIFQPFDTCHINKNRSMNPFSKFWKLTTRVMDPKDDVSSKRFALIMSMVYFFFSNFLFTVIATIVIFTTNKGDIELIKIFISFIKELIYYNFLIIVSILGLITVVDMGYAAVEKAKARFRGHNFNNNNNNENGEVIGGPYN